MKKIVIALFMMHFANAQVGIGTNTPHSSAVLDVYSQDKGMLFPRLTLVQRNLINLPTAGLVVWCSNCGSNGELQVFNGVAWTNLIGDPASVALSVPEIVTSSGSVAISNSKISGKGTVSSNGSATITEAGFCYSASNSMPTKENSSFITANVGTSFQAIITGLTSETLYYIRAYAINSMGIAYGDVLPITTLVESITPPGETNLDNYLDEDLFNALFPFRADKLLSQTGPEFYSYSSLKNAVSELGNIKIEIVKRQNPDLTLISYTYKLKRTNLIDNSVTELIYGNDYNESWNSTKPEITEKTINFSDFLGSANADENKKELAAFFANISHETTGGGDIEPTKTYGLYFKEEVYCAPPNTPCAGYTAEDAQFPGVPGKYYHGRGTIQLTWNYNYGPTSFIMFGDKNILLNNPDLVTSEAKYSFMTGIIFWMLPQSPKPSCHEVIHEPRGFAKTIMVINGGLECGATNYANPVQVSKVNDRIGFYKKYSNDFGLTVDETDFNLNCEDLLPY